jgi:hypothetical protein
MAAVAIAGDVALSAAMTRGMQDAKVRLIVWTFVAVFVFPIFFVVVFLTRWLRRSLTTLLPVGGAGTAVRPKTRLLLYISIAAVTVPADRVWAKAGHWSLSRVLLWDFAILALLIAIMEFMEWRKRRLSKI